MLMQGIDYKTFQISLMYLLTRNITNMLNLDLVQDYSILHFVQDNHEHMDNYV